MYIYSEGEECNVCHSATPKQVLGCIAQRGLAEISETEDGLVDEYAISCGHQTSNPLTSRPLWLQALVSPKHELEF